MMGAYLLAVVGIAVYAIVGILWQSNRQANQVSHLLAHMAQQQTAHARERSTLLAHVQAPQMAAVGAIPAPAMPDPREVLSTLGLLRPSVPEPAVVDEDDVDESHLVGTGPEFAGMSPELA